MITTLVLFAALLRGRAALRTRQAGNRGEILFPKAQRHVDQADQDRHFHQGTDDRGKSRPELMPKTATATAMASSKLLLAAVKDRVAVLE